jgi:hypothetical protein
MVNLKGVLLAGTIFFSGCMHMQIGNFNLENKKIPVRQIKIFDKGDCIMNSKYLGCLLVSDKDVCNFYIDANNNGRYDIGIDLPAGEPSVCRTEKDPQIEIRIKRDLPSESLPTPNKYSTQFNL